MTNAPIPIIPTVTIEEVSTTYNQEPAAPAPAPAPANEEPPVLRYSIYRQQNALLVTEPSGSEDTSDSFPAPPSN